MWWKESKLIWQRTNWVPQTWNTIRTFLPWAGSERCFSLMIESETTHWQCEGDYFGKLLVPKHKECLGEAWEGLGTIPTQILQPFPGNWWETLQRAPMCFNVKFMTDKLISCTKIDVTCPPSVSCIIRWLEHFLSMIPWCTGIIHTRKAVTRDH